jgi:hypothetical protein
MQRISAWATAAIAVGVVMAAVPSPSRADSCFQSEVSYGRAVIHLCIDPSGQKLTKHEVSGAQGSAVARRSVSERSDIDPSGVITIGFSADAATSLLPLRVTSRYLRLKRIAEYQACEWDDGYGWSQAVPRCLTRRLGDLDSECWRNCSDWLSYTPARN